MLGESLEGHAELRTFTVLLQQDLQLLYCNKASSGHVLHSSQCCTMIHKMHGANSGGVHMWAYNTLSVSLGGAAEELTESALYHCMYALHSCTATWQRQTPVR